MRESSKSSGASKEQGSGAGVRRRGEIPTEVGRRRGDDEADKWGPHGDDRGRKRPAREGVI
jgi:hypothetical protein